jgi:hypothetical protein
VSDLVVEDELPKDKQKTATQYITAGSAAASDFQIGTALPRGAKTS